MRHKLPSALGLLVTLVFVPLPAAAFIWNVTTEYPETAMPGQGLETFARLLAEDTKGQVTLVPTFDGGPRALRSAAIPDAVKNGALEIGDTFSGAIAKLDPLFQLSSLPFLATTDAEARKLYEAALPDYRRVFEKLGQKLLYATPWPPSGIWSRRPVREVDDLRGLSIRTYDLGSTEVMRQAGARSVELSFGDTMPKLRDGSVDAVLSSGDGGAGRRLWEVTPNFTEIGYARPLSFTTVSTKAFDALPLELQAAVLKAAADTEATQWRALTTRTEENYSTMRKNGVEIIAPSAGLKALLADAARLTIDAFAKSTDVRTAAILDGFRKGK